MRLLLFADPRAATSKILVREAVRVARERGDVEVVGVCDTGRTPAGHRDIARAVSVAVLKRCFDRAHPVVLDRPLFERLVSTCRRLRVPLLVPPGRNVNAPAFLDRLRSEVRPDFALSLICLQVFSRELLSLFARAVNYHNGLLPAYRGLRATGWSLYHQEPTTGFSYHVMTTGLDEGPVLVEGTVPVRPEASVPELERDKTRHAATRMAEVLEALVRGAPGRVQTGPAGYFGRRELQAVRAIPDPASLTWDELRRRLRAFDLLTLTLAGQPLYVTRLRRLDGRPARRRALAFTTRDGVAAEPDRFLHLPLSLYRWYHAVAPRAAEPRW